MLSLIHGAVLAQALLHFVHPDHLNTPRVITNQAGQVVWRWDQTEPFGADPPNENPSGLGTFIYNLRLPGQHFDKETNLHYNYFRDYDPGIGRYIQSDPIGLEASLNTYAYVGSNPTGYWDPLGLRWYGGGGWINWYSTGRGTVPPPGGGPVPAPNTPLGFPPPSPGPRRGCINLVCPIPNPTGPILLTPASSNSCDRPIPAGTFGGLSGGGTTYMSGPFLSPPGGLEDCICLKYGFIK
jgi:RHS repeat-associated protein